MIPTSLRVVALLQLLGGLSAVAGMLVGLPAGSIHLDLGVAGIPTYFGLMRLSDVWRTWAVAFAWMGMLASAALFTFGLLAHVPAELQIFGVRYGNISARWGSAVALPMFVLSLWQYRVLTRPDVRALFLQHAPEAIGSVGA